MFQAIFFGFLYGFILCFTFGPAFFRLIQTSIDTGFKRGVLIALGVTIADSILMFFAVFGTSLLPNLEHFDDVISVVGASLLFILGFNSLFKEQSQLVYPTSKFGSFLYYFTSGLFLNLLNPSNYVAVFATSAYLVAKGLTLNERIGFFLFSLIATMIAESLIAFYAQKMKRLLTKKVLKRINQVAGLIFIGSGLMILWKQFMN
ncbi:LysE family transporter [Arcicella sp. LKC2W]|uniref:LysE family translocator n=1 Tax=Arcicella sp. LKC2W TaxID=2984198 RepID=UPI002B1EA0D8|nr:LysE family transporter [Arcicella sp. LKC2W]MEA5458542.1 LysE family transporter [Arcicella sp. LKC2W]